MKASEQKKPKKRKRLELNAQMLHDLLGRIREQVGAADFEIIECLVLAFLKLIEVLKGKKASLARLRRILFGPKSEKTRDVLGKGKDANNKASSSEDKTGSPEKTKRKGHGRRPSKDFTSAKKNFIPHQTLKVGCDCPECGKGTLYRLKESARGIEFTGQPFVDATIHEGERLRCSACQGVFTANLPVPAGTKTYKASAKSMCVVLKYGTGLPFYRLEKLQAAMGIPLPSSVQWEIALGVYFDVYPVYQAMVLLAAQGEIFFNDDTKVKIQSLMKAAREVGKEAIPEIPEDPATPKATGKKKNKKPASERKGMYTTVIVSVQDGQEIVLYFSGRQYSGENMDDLLRQRAKDLAKPLQMCDGSEMNKLDEFETILCNCLSHGRRYVVDVIENFPESCQYILETLREVYKNDRQTKISGLNPEERLAYHKIKSGPLMEKLEKWFREQLDEKKTEPNSGLGEAITYFLDRWEALTRFLHVPGAPLDNNTAEQAIKLVILNRKNAYHFRTERGAAVGDTFMSFIETCRRCGANPHAYLTALLEHKNEASKNPQDWLPWNYQEALGKIAPEEGQRNQRAPPTRTSCESSEHSGSPRARSTDQAVRAMAPASRAQFPQRG